MHASLKKSAFIITAVIALISTVGCPPPPPPPVAVLAGTWKLTPAPPNVTDFLVTFDDDGDITRIQYTYTDPSNNVPLTVEIEDPDFVNANVSVDGSTVAITATWGAVNNIEINGTLNESQDQIDGTATYFVQVGNVTVSLPTTNAQLTRQ